MVSQKLKSLFTTVLFLAVLAALAYYVNKPPDQPNEQRSLQVEPANHEAPIGKSQEYFSVGFVSKQKLTQHYQKHGGEFGQISLAEYLRLAQRLRDRTPGIDILEHIRPDGITSRYEKRTGIFVAFNKDKTLRTCFKPNDGESYFHRQKNKIH